MHSLIPGSDRGSEGQTPTNYNLVVACLHRFMIKGSDRSDDLYICCSRK